MQNGINSSFSILLGNSTSHWKIKPSKFQPDRRRSASLQTLRLQVHISQRGIDAKTLQRGRLPSRSNDSCYSTLCVYRGRWWIKSNEVTWTAEASSDWSQSSTPARRHWPTRWRRFATSGCDDEVDNGRQRHERVAWTEFCHTEPTNTVTSHTYTLGC